MWGETRGRLGETRRGGWMKPVGWMMVGVGLGLVGWWGSEAGEPQYREVLVRELQSGFVVECRPARNPYPVWERATSVVDGVMGSVAACLTGPRPRPLWR
jgi:hypothetical protein